MKQHANKNYVLNSHPGAGSKGLSILFTERSHVAYQIKSNGT